MVTDPVKRDWEGEITLLTVGRVDREKNPLLLVECMAAMDQAEPGRYRLQWVGDGPLVEAVRERAATLGVESRIDQLGHVPFGPRLLELYRRAHVFVHVSLTEGTPQVLVEALASGTPVIATDVGGVRRALDGGRAGVLVPPGDRDALAGAIGRMCADPDPARAPGGNRARACTRADARGRGLPHGRVSGEIARPNLDWREMCGICGVISQSGAAESRALVERMNRTLVHRGPDSGGVFVESGAAIAARRLAIIDLETGDQPLTNEDGSVAVVQNGEIYNYRELRGELQASGHEFRTQGDTEVLAHLYEERGPRFAEALRGMFAVAVLDLRRRRVVLARDRFGIKPLYYRDKRRNALVRLGAEGAPGSAGTVAGDRTARPRVVPRLQLRAGPAVDLQRGPQAPARHDSLLGHGRRRASP